MQAKVILAVMAIAFLAAAAWRVRRDSGRIAPASKTWLLVAGAFALVSMWLWMR
jgi:hypothetical protein